jgi:DNA polymerase elongation subunit (family B)
MAVWLLDEAGRARKIVEPFEPSIYVREPEQGCPALWRMLRGRPVREVEKIEFTSGRPIRVWQIPTDPLSYPKLSRALQKLQDEIELFNADVPLPQLFFYERRLFPLAEVDERLQTSEDSSWSIDYRLPPLKMAYLRSESGEVDPRHTRPGRLLWTEDGATTVIEWEDDRLGLETLRGRLVRSDPDVLLTDWGDAFLVPRLLGLSEACGVPLPLNRDAGSIDSRQAKSYVSYGRQVYKAGWQMLKGRWHLDLMNTFILGEAGFEGLWELSRMSKIPVQLMARTSTGTAITSMQLDEAVRRNILIPWQKRTPEDFKTAEELLMTDKGGLVYVPRPGLYENVGEIDFASMFPAIMVRHNISPETVNCDCCPEATVPGITHRICRKRSGLVPAVLAPIVAKRAEFKRRFKATGDARWKEKSTGLKWVLVTCLEGSTRVLVRRNGVVGVETIQHTVERGASGLQAAGIDASGRPEWKNVSGVIRTRRRGPLYRVRFSGGREVQATADHLWPVVTPKGLKMIRTDALATKHRVPALQKLRKSMWKAFRFRPSKTARVRSIEKLRGGPRTVYCLQLDSPQPWFVVQGGVLTHNCFGYLGYKNARFGRIEAHECVTAFSRDKLLRAKELAEERGFEVVHAIVDSLYLRRPGATREDYEALARAIGETTGVDAAVENVYDWIAFYPARLHKLWGVPNRFVGCAGGELKIRGVEARRHDVPPIVRAMQGEMLRRLARARTAAEYRAALPELRAIFEAYAERVRSGRATMEELVVTRRLSHRPEEYRVDNATAVAAKQLAARGAELMPGQEIQLIITDAASQVPEERAMAYGLAPTRYDARRYVELLESALATMESVVPKEIIRTGQLLLPW